MQLVGRRPYTSTRRACSPSPCGAPTQPRFPARPCGHPVRERGPAGPRSRSWPPLRFSCLGDHWRSRNAVGLRRLLQLRARPGYAMSGQCRRTRRGRRGRGSGRCPCSRERRSCSCIRPLSLRRRRVYPRGRDPAVRAQRVATSRPCHAVGATGPCCFIPGS